MRHRQLRAEDVRGSHPGPIPRRPTLGGRPDTWIHVPDGLRRAPRRVPLSAVLAGRREQEELTRPGARPRGSRAGHTLRRDHVDPRGASAAGIPARERRHLLGHRGGETYDEIERRLSACATAPTSGESEDQLEVARPSEPGPRLLRRLSAGCPRDRSSNVRAVEAGPTLWQAPRNQHLDPDGDTSGSRTSRFRTTSAPTGCHPPRSPPSIDHGGTSGSSSASRRATTRSVQTCGSTCED